MLGGRVVHTVPRSFAPTLFHRGCAGTAKTRASWGWSAKAGSSVLIRYVHPPQDVTSHCYQDRGPTKCTVRGLGVGKVSVGPLGWGTCSTRAEEGLAGKARCGTDNLDSKWLPQVAVQLCWQVGEGNGTSQLFCSWRSPSWKLFLPGNTLRWVINSPSPTCQHRHSSNCCFHALSLQVVCCAVFLRVETQFPITLPALLKPKTDLLLFEVPGFKSHWSWRTHEIQPLWFSKPNIMRIRVTHTGSQVWGLSPLHPGVSLPPPSFPPTDSTIGPLASNHFSALPTFFHVVFSLHLVVGSVIPGCFLGYLHWYECHLVVSMGQGEPRILLLCHLPWSLASTFHMLFKWSLLTPSILLHYLSSDPQWQLSDNPEPQDIH